jgi:hypothetical protein
VSGQKPTGAANIYYSKVLARLRGIKL